MIAPHHLRERVALCSSRESAEMINQEVTDVVSNDTDVDGASLFLGYLNCSSVADVHIFFNVHNQALSRSPL